MKAQFKYAFLAGGIPRIYVFAAIFVFQLVFILLGETTGLPLAAHITAVALSGVMVSVMTVFNVIGDISIVRRMFYGPGAYLTALTPVPRHKTLLASVISMIVMDVVTMAIVITGLVRLSLNLGQLYMNQSVWEMAGYYVSVLPIILFAAAHIIAGYLLFMMIILFCITARKSLFFHKRAGRLLTFLLAVGTLYATTLVPLILAPFAYIDRYFFVFQLHLRPIGSALYPILLFIMSAVLFIMTSKLMERKMNI